VPISIARRADQSRSLNLFACRETWARVPLSRHLGQRIGDQGTQKHQSAVCLALEIHRFRSAPTSGPLGGQKEAPWLLAQVPVVVSVGLHRAQIRHGSINDDAPVGHRQILR
jgi:hypothetical protein